MNPRKENEAEPSGRPRGRIRVGGFAGSKQSQSITRSTWRRLGECQPSRSQPSFGRSSLWANRPTATSRYGSPVQSAINQSFVLQDDGSFLPKMVPGPACFTHWQASYRVLRTTLVMTEVVSLANLMEWEALV